jgi:ankyrin repeat protein
MAVKGQSLVVVEELIKADPSTINLVDNKGNTALHIATRKGRTQVNLTLPAIILLTFTQPVTS